MAKPLFLNVKCGGFYIGIFICNYHPQIKIQDTSNTQKISLSPSQAILSPNVNF